MKKRPTKPTHGGARPNAGKKPGVHGKKKKRGLSFAPDTIAFLATLTPTDERPDLPGASQFTEKLIRSTKAFKDWKSEPTNSGKVG